MMIIKGIIDHILLNFYAAYRSPKINTNLFIEQLDIFLENNINKNLNENIILIGDINIDILDHNISVNKYLNSMMSYGFSPTVSKPTQIIKNSATCIDHCFLKTLRPLSDIYAAIIQENITNHYPIILKFKKYSSSKIKIKNKTEKLIFDEVRLNKLMCL